MTKLSPFIPLWNRYNHFLQVTKKSSMPQNSDYQCSSPRKKRQHPGPLGSERKWSRSVVSDSLRGQGLEPTRRLRPWDFPGKSTGVGCHFLLQGIFPTQGSNPGLPHCRQTLYRLSHQGSWKGSFKPSVRAHPSPSFKWVLIEKETSGAGNVAREIHPCLGYRCKEPQVSPQVTLRMDTPCP